MRVNGNWIEYSELKCNFRKKRLGHNTAKKCPEFDPYKKSTLRNCFNCKKIREKMIWPQEKTE